jgi:phage/plasmid-associated DNA primase
VLAGHRVPVTARPGWRPFTQHPSLPGHPSRAQLQHYRISILATELDAHPELANTPSGIVDLRSGTVKPHDADLLLTRITAHGVDLQAPHPRWDAFLAETFQKDGKPDQELISYMQRLAGLAALGNVLDHILPFLHGIQRQRCLHLGAPRTARGC